MEKSEDGWHENGRASRSLDGPPAHSPRLPLSSFTPQGGTFLGSISILPATPGAKPINLALGLLRAGLARLQPGMDPSRLSSGAELAEAQKAAKEARAKVGERLAPQVQIPSFCFPVPICRSGTMVLCRPCLLLMFVDVQPGAMYPQLANHLTAFSHLHPQIWQNWSPEQEKAEAGEQEEEAGPGGWGCPP